MKLPWPHIVEADPVSTAASGLFAQRTRMNVLANNIANVNTTRDEKGNFAPYLRKEILFKTAEINPDKPDEQGVLVHQILPSNMPLRRVYEPEHPEADEKGYRFEPSVKVTQEMANFIEASRAYEANLNAMKIASESMGQTIGILDDKAALNDES